MMCPTCNTKLIVIETRVKLTGVYRRYKCTTCKGKPIPTMERITYKPVKVKS